MDTKSLQAIWPGLVLILFDNFLEVIITLNLSQCQVKALTPRSKAGACLSGARFRCYPLG
jgi:hypothetical protein